MFNLLEKKNDYTSWWIYSSCMIIPLDKKFKVMHEPNKLKTMGSIDVWNKKDNSPCLSVLCFPPFLIDLFSWIEVWTLHRRKHFTCTSCSFKEHYSGSCKICLISGKLGILKWFFCKKKYLFTRYFFLDNIGCHFSLVIAKIYSYFPWKNCKEIKQSK